MEKIAFEQCVLDAFSVLPERFRKLVDNVALLVEDEPSEEVRASEGLGEHETLFGLYSGIPKPAGTTPMALGAHCRTPSPSTRTP